MKRLQRRIHNDVFTSKTRLVAAVLARSAVLSRASNALQASLLELPSDLRILRLRVCTRRRRHDGGGERLPTRSRASTSRFASIRLKVANIKLAFSRGPRALLQLPCPHTLIIRFRRFNFLVVNTESHFLTPNRDLCPPLLAPFAPTNAAVSRRSRSARHRQGPLSAASAAPHSA
jgi:hypothetical protein